jgi:hypothetical protein
MGKTGGTALKHALLEHLDESRHRLLLHGHDVTLAHVPRGEPFMFILRDPISRFVSAFNSRLRAGRPRYSYPWRDEERLAFATFDSPDRLATALSSEDGAERASAERAMRGIAHLDTPYRHWFGDPQSFRRRLSDVFFIAFQERLDGDFELLKQKLGLPPHARLPSDLVAGHRSPLSSACPLGRVARWNLERWYEADLAFVELCRELAPLVNFEEVPRARTLAARAPRSPAPRTPAPRQHRHRRGWRRVLVEQVLAGVAAFATSAVVVEAFTDRDWSVSGFEWFADSAAAAGLGLVPPALNAMGVQLRSGRRHLGAGRRRIGTP